MELEHRNDNGVKRASDLQQNEAGGDPIQMMKMVKGAAPKRAVVADNGGSKGRGVNAYAGDRSEGPQGPLKNIEKEREVDGYIEGQIVVGQQNRLAKTRGELCAKHLASRRTSITMTRSSTSVIS